MLPIVAELLPICRYLSAPDANVIYPPNIYGHNICAEGSTFFPVKPLAAFCPVACACRSGDAHCPLACPARNDSVAELCPACVAPSLSLSCFEPGTEAC